MQAFPLQRGRIRFLSVKGLTAMKLTETIAYWVATLLMFAIMLMAIISYHVDHDRMAGYFEHFGYPTYIVYPLAYAKALALIAIATNYYRNLKDIAYGAYFLNMVAATVGHVMAGDQPIHAYVGLVAVPVSYILSNRVRGEPKRDAFIL